MVRPHIDDRAVRVLRAAVPAFEDCYLDLVQIYDEDLTPHVVFTELADFVSNLFDEGDDEELVEACFEAVEQVAKTPGVDVTEVVGYGFLDGLRPDALETARGYIGPVTERVLAYLDAGEPELPDGGEPRFADEPEEAFSRAAEPAVSARPR